jgi:hypothetical protein
MSRRRTCTAADSVPAAAADEGQALARAREIIATIPPMKVTLLEIMHGCDPVKIAGAWQALQAQRARRQ